MKTEAEIKNDLANYQTRLNILKDEVRDIGDDFRNGIETQVMFLESQGNKVYYPSQDTDQHDFTGLRICEDNRRAMKDADIVYVIWDGKSQGCLFDLGMAFAMKKKIRTITGYFPSMSKGKSFQNMVYKWEEIK
jgi:nucleoside 2-deoxyribosyltransferase